MLIELVNYAIIEINLNSQTHAHKHVHTYAVAILLKLIHIALLKLMHILHITIYIQTNIIETNTNTRIIRTIYNILISLLNQENLFNL